MDKPDIHKLVTRQLLAMLRAARARESLEAMYAEPSAYWDPADMPPFNLVFTIEELKAELATREHVPTGDERKKQRLARGKR